MIIVIIYFWVDTFVYNGRKIFIRINIVWSIFGCAFRLLHWNCGCLIFLFLLLFILLCLYHDLFLNLFLKLSSEIIFLLNNILLYFFFFFLLSQHQNTLCSVTRFKFLNKRSGKLLWAAKRINAFLTLNCLSSLTTFWATHLTRNSFADIYHRMLPRFPD